MLRRDGLLFCLIGPAGGGKTTFCERLLASHAGTLELSISVTTRPPRSNELDGSSYFFVTHEEFKAKVEKGQFYEWEEIHGQYYGTLKSTVDQAIRSGVDLLLDIDIKGALNFKTKVPENTVIVFLSPPSSNELKRRLLARGSIDEDNLRVRLGTAAIEYQQLTAEAAGKRRIDYFVVNDVLDRAYGTVESILAAERSRLNRINFEDLKVVCRI